MMVLSWERVRMRLCSQSKLLDCVPCKWAAGASEIGWFDLLLLQVLLPGQSLLGASLCVHSSACFINCGLCLACRTMWLLLWI